jgi:hypothetical protein
MSAIRPPVPSPLFPTQTPSPPARPARASFFQAALEGLKAAAAVDAAPAAGESLPAAPTAAAATPDRSGRPGALLDIRI